MIICEIGLNHLGKEDYADEYIEQVLKSKADALTFQIKQKSFYQKEKSGLKLSPDYYKKAVLKTKSENKKFGLAIADENLIDYFEKLDVDFYKILCGNMMDFSLINKLIETKKPVFISTGTSETEEIRKMIKNIKSKENITLIHMQLSYDISDVNLAAIPFLRKKFNLPVAFGSHCPNNNVLLLSLAYKPSDIFFYIKGKKTEKHPDEEHAVEFKNLGRITDCLIELSKAIGKGLKTKIDNSIPGNI